MSGFSPSLRNRVKRLEIAESVHRELSFGERLTEAEARFASEAAEQREANERADCIASLSEPDASGSFSARLQRARRRLGREYQQEVPR